ncbi:MAG TPA: hypothetical protein GXX36_11700 [Clostridiaceae bacterium]|nr:hypothetical protein [Clostridiaceae bacterium]
MNHRSRFKALFTGEHVDRIPIYFFGTWPETKLRWQNEGFDGYINLKADAGPQVPGMDPDWEYDMWGCHGLVNTYLIGDISPCVLEETDQYIIRRNSVGDIYKESKLGSSVVHTLEYGLKPTRESWLDFKRYLDPEDKRRRPDDWIGLAAQVNEKDMLLAFMGGSLYGWLRNWMGIEAVSLLMYDDPNLLEEMVSHIVDMFIILMEPVLKKVKFDLVYFFEDCCGADGPLFSPSIYRKIFDKYYKKLISFYKSNGVEFALIDSDGRVDSFIPLWLESGFDIIFPVEVGKWGCSPSELRMKFGDDLKMMGGVDKHMISKGEEDLRRHLLELKSEVDKGGFLPIPDHRIPPECSYKQILKYVEIFNEVFNQK